jgi:hypothetical protein
MTTATKRRADRAEIILDLLDFVEEKIKEAIDNPAAQVAAATEAGCAMPVLRDRLCEDEVEWTKFLLVMGNRIEQGYWRAWWRDVAVASHEDFLEEAATLGKQLSVLRAIVTRRVSRSNPLTYLHPSPANVGTSPSIRRKPARLDHRRPQRRVGFLDRAELLGRRAGGDQA